MWAGKEDQVLPASFQKPENGCSMASPKQLCTSSEVVWRGWEGSSDHVAGPAPCAHVLERSQSPSVWRLWVPAHTRLVPRCQRPPKPNPRPDLRKPPPTCETEAARGWPPLTKHAACTTSAGHDKQGHGFSPSLQSVAVVMLLTYLCLSQHSCIMGMITEPSPLEVASEVKDT